MFGVLHAHSVYSLNDSPQTPEALVKRTKELGYQDVTLTDHGTLLGIEEFLEAGEKYGINAVPGIEAYLDNREHFLLIAKDEEGYKAIRKASREANNNITVIRKLKFPCMKEETLIRYFSGNDHVIATSACISGPISRILLKNYKKRKVIEKFRPYKDAEEIYEEAQTAYKASAEKLKEYKKELTHWKGFTKPAFIEGINKIRAKLKDKPNDPRLLSRLQEKETAVQTAKRQIEPLEKEIDFWKKDAQKWKGIRDANASNAKKYRSLPEDLFTMFSEEELYIQAKEKAVFYKSIFPNFYLEIQYHGLETEKYVMPLLVKISNETGIPLIAANDAHITLQ